MTYDELFASVSKHEWKHRTARFPSLLKEAFHLLVFNFEKLRKELKHDLLMEFSFDSLDGYASQGRGGTFGWAHPTQVPFAMISKEDPFVIDADNINASHGDIEGFLLFDLTDGGVLFIATPEGFIEEDTRVEKVAKSIKAIKIEEGSELD